MIWILLTAILLLIPKYRPYGVAAALALISMQLISNGIIKPLVARPRPCWLVTSVPLLISNPQDFSFPSGHTAASLAVTTVLFLLHHPWRKWAFAWAMLIAFSRLYLFVHFPTDVFGGAVIGMFLGWMTVMGLRIYAAKKSTQRENDFWSIYRSSGF